MAAINELNKAIETIRKECQSNNECRFCPMLTNCFVSVPSGWDTIEDGETDEKCEHAEKHNGKCLGYQKSEWNDEPIEECENCHLYDGLKDGENK